MKVRIKDLRDKKNISQQLLAKLTGIPRSRITEFECEYREPSEEEMKTIKKAINQYKGEASHGTVNT